MAKNKKKLTFWLISLIINYIINPRKKAVFARGPTRRVDKSKNCTSVFRHDEGLEAISPSQQNVLRVGLLSALMLVIRTRSRGTRCAVFPYVFRFMSMLRRGVVVPRTPTRISSVLPQRSVNSFDATWFPHLFRFEKTDFPVLLEALQIPAVVNTGGHSRVSCTGWDALGITLRRLAYPCR